MKTKNTFENIGKDNSGNVALTNTIKTANNKKVIMKNNKKYKVIAIDTMYILKLTFVHPNVRKMHWVSGQKLYVKDSSYTGK